MFEELREELVSFGGNGFFTPFGMHVLDQDALAKLEDILNTLELIRKRNSDNSVNKLSEYARADYLSRWTLSILYPEKPDLGGTVRGTARVVPFQQVWLGLQGTGLKPSLGVFEGSLRGAMLCVLCCAVM